MSQKIRKKIEHLVQLADRPGTPEEGENAKARAIALSVKYGIPCKFTKEKPKPKPGPLHRANGEEHQNTLMNPWVTGLAAIGWNLREEVSTKVGRQFRFRKEGKKSEIRITQRKNGTDFEAEQIMYPDPNSAGYDMSYTVYMTIHLRELLTHLS